MGLLPPTIVEVKAVITEFQKKMAEVRGELDATQKKGETSFGGMAQYGQAALAGIVTGAVALGVEAIHLADTFEVSHARLTASLAANGLSFDQWASQIGAADKAGEKLGFTNQQVEDGLARLETMVKNPTVALTDLAVAEDVARARGIDLTQAAQAVGKASEGTYTALVRLGVVTKDQAASFTSGAQAVDYLGHAFGGQAAAYAETFAGKMQVLKATSEDIGKNIGLFLIPKIELFASALSDGIHFIEDNRAAQAALAGTVTALVLPALTKMAIGLGTTVVEAVSGAAASMLEMIVPAQAVAGAFAEDAVAASAAGVSIDAMLGPIGIAIGVIAALAVGFGGAGDAAKRAGDIWANEFTAKLSGTANESDTLKQKIADLITATDAMSQHSGAWQINLTNWTASHRGASDAVKQNRQEISDLQKALDALTIKHQADIAATDVAAAADAAATETKKQLAHAVKDTSTEVKELTTATDLYFNSALAADRADITWATHADALKTSIAKQGNTLDINTAAGRANKTIVDDLVDSTLKNIEATLKSGQSADQTRPLIQGYIDKLHGVETQTGLTTAEIAALDIQYGLTPISVTTQINVNAAAAEAALTALANQASAISGSGLAGVAGILTAIGSTVLRPVGAKAAGGPVVAGSPYLVGEGGRELFVPGVSGTILTNAQTDAAMVGASAHGYMQQVADRVAMLATTASAAMQMVQASAAMAGVATPPGGASAWTALATQVAGMLGQPGSVGAIVRRINFESGGNPTAINRTDSNWLAGHPSVGLAQVIDSTFRGNAGQFAGVGPFAYGVSEDPLANVYAGMNYATHRYGSIAAVDPLVMHSGYDNGGWLHPGLTMAYNGTGQSERVIGPGGGGGGDLHVHLHGDVYGPGGLAQVADTIRRELIRQGRGKTSIGLA